MTDRLTASPIERDVVIVSGADAAEYLQTQLTQDVLALSPRESAWSFLLTPKSEIEALVRVTRTESDAVLLDVDPSYGPAVRERLDGLLFRMDVSFEEARWPGVAWRGPGAHEVTADAPIVIPLSWTRSEALDVVGPDVSVPADVAALAPDDLDALRIGAGWPGMGAEIDGSVTPAMTGLVGQTVSFTKGCYTGQEFVARVHYREAEPPRRLVLISFDVGADVDPSSEIETDGEVVGELTSVARSVGVALGYLRRSVDVPTIANVGSTTVNIEPV